MKKRVIALLGGAALLVGSAAIPLSTAHGVTASRSCRLLIQEANLLEARLEMSGQSLTPRQRMALEAQLEQVLTAEQFTCPPG